MEKRNPTQHRMTRRCAAHDYTAPGIYHITMHVADALGHPLGAVVGSLAAPDGSADAPRVALSPIGQMVEHELLHAIPSFYPMIEIQDYVIMPEHLHFIIEVHDAIITRNGHPAHLGQVIAGFKKGCNRRYWEMTGQGETLYQRGKPAGTNAAPGLSAPLAISAFGSSAPASEALGPAAPGLSAPLAIPAFGSSAPAEALGPAAPVFSASAPLVGSAFGPSAPASLADPASAALGLLASIGAASVAGVGAPAVFPQEVRAPFKVPSRCTSGRAPLFAAGYCDVMPLRGGQLATQRAYIKGNPRSRLLRSGSRSLHVQRGGIATALTPAALCGFLRRECGAAFTPAAWEEIRADLLMAPDGTITCDTFGSRALLAGSLLPVVCHRKDAARFGEQKQRCLDAAARGAVLVSARIAKGEQAIMDEALHGGFPVVLIADNGFGDRYHPSADRLSHCAAGRQLLVTPWTFQYKGTSDSIHVPRCKTMNCVAQALCHTKDNWWKHLHSYNRSRTGATNQ